MGQAACAWPEGAADLMAWGLALVVESLPACPFVLRPGVTVTDAARLLAGLQSAIALGPWGPRAVSGALARDLRDLARVIDADAAPSEGGPAARPAAALELGELNPAEHLARLTGFEGARSKLGMMTAHLLWDAARLWERDRGKPAEARWGRLYRETWAKAREEAN